MLDAEDAAETRDEIFQNANCHVDTHVIRLRQPRTLHVATLLQVVDFDLRLVRIVRFDDHFALDGDV